MQQRFDPEVESVLREAGWYPGRKVPEQQLQKWSDMRPLFPAVQRILEEFGGIFVKERGFSGLQKGVTVDLKNARDSFCFEPEAALGYISGNPDFDCYEDTFDSKIYPVGLQSCYYDVITHNGEPIIRGRDTLLADEQGRLFLIDYNLVLVGDDFDTSLSNLILNAGMRLWDSKSKRPLPNWPAPQHTQT